MLLACCLQSRLVYRVWVAAVGCWLRFVFLWILIHSNPREPISAAVEQKCLIKTAASAFMVAVRLWTLKLVFTGTSDVCCGRLCQSKNHVCADCAVIGLKHPSHSGSSQTPLLVTMVTGWSRHSTERHRCLTAHLFPPAGPMSDHLLVSPPAAATEDAACIKEGRIQVSTMNKCRLDCLKQSECLDLKPQSVLAPNPTVKQAKSPPACPSLSQTFQRNCWSLHYNQSRLVTRILSFWGELNWQ